MSWPVWRGMLFLSSSLLCSFFFFNDTATTEIYTLSLHDALPIHQRRHILASADAGLDVFDDRRRRDPHGTDGEAHRVAGPVVVRIGFDADFELGGGGAPVRRDRNGV